MPLRLTIGGKGFIAWYPETYAESPAQVVSWQEALSTPLVRSNVSLHKWRGISLVPGILEHWLPGISWRSAHGSFISSDVDEQSVGGIVEISLCRMLC